MKTFIYKISSVLLAFVVLLSTVSFTVEKHYCKGHLVDVSYFGNANDCSSLDEDADHCEKGDRCHKNCCKDEIKHLENQQDLQQSSIKKLSLDNQTLIVAFVLVKTGFFEWFDTQYVSALAYKPPKITSKLHILHEVYLI